MLLSTAVGAERVGPLRKEERTAATSAASTSSAIATVRPAHMGAMFLNRLELFRKLRITNLI